MLKISSRAFYGLPGFKHTIGGPQREMKSIAKIIKNIITVGKGELIKGVKTPVAKESSGLVYKLPRQEHPD